MLLVVVKLTMVKCNDEETKAPPDFGSKMSVLYVEIFECRPTNGVSSENLNSTQSTQFNARLTNEAN